MIIPNIESLKQKQIRSLQNLVDWFEQNIPHTPWGTAHAHKMKDIQDFTYVLNRTHDAIELEVDLSWSVTGIHKPEDDLMLLQSNTEDLKIVETDHFNQMLTLVFRFNLDAWPNFIPHIISTSLYAYAHPEQFDSAKSVKLEADVTAVLCRYYPEVTLNFLKTAIDVGMYRDGAPGFASWFSDHVSKQANTRVDLPDDLQGMSLG